MEVVRERHEDQRHNHDIMRKRILNKLLLHGYSQGEDR